MSIHYDEPPLSKVPIWATVKAGYVQTYRNFGAFLTAATVPFLLSMGVTAVLASAPEGLGTTILGTAVDTAIAAVFVLVWYRHLLLTTVDARPHLLPRPGPRLLAYIAYAWLLALPLIPSLLATEQYETSDSGTAESQLRLYLFHVATAIAFYVAAVYLNFRLGFLFLWLSIDEKGRLAASWRLTRGNGLRLLVVAAIVTAPILAAFVVGTFIAATVFPEILNDLETVDLGTGRFWFTTAAEVALSYALYGLIATAMVHAFRILTGPPGDQREILERFE